jgi:capsular exopolysaccharide synthesis family protein
MQDQRISTVLWRGKWIILVAVAVGIALAVFATKRTDKVYQATAILQVNAGTPSAVNQSPSDVQFANQILASTYATRIGDRSFFEQAKSRILGGELGAGGLQDRVGARAIENTALVEITAEGNSPVQARQLAADVADAFVGEIRKEALTTSQQQQKTLQGRISQLTGRMRRTSNSADLEALRGARAQLQARLADVIATGIQQGESVRAAAPPTASPTPIRPRPLVNLLAGILLGLLSGIGLSWLRLRLDRGLHSSAEVEELTDVPVLASIPVRRRFSRDDPVLGEAYDVLRANLAFIGLDRPLQVITLSSFNPREGKTSTAEGLAYAAGRGGMSVVLVDADVRTRTLTTRLGHDGAPGLTNVVVGTASVDDALVALAPGISLLPAGPTPPNPPSLLASGQMRDLVDDLRSQFSLVLIDSPPVAHLADASILASVSDGVIVVARVGVTARSDLTSASLNLRHSPTPILGVVLLERRTIDDTYYPAIAKGPPQVPETAETI